MLNKKLAVFLTAAVFAFGGSGALPVIGEDTAITASAEQYGDLIYEVSNNAITITAYSGSSSKVPIPMSINGYKVKAIGDNAFFQCDMISEIVLPDGVETIGENAFVECTALKKVNLPDTIKEIGVCAFSGCSSITEVKLPKNIKAVREAAFADCTALKTLYIPETEAEIGGEAFLGCTALKEVTIPAEVKKIGDGAFGFYLGDDENAEYAEVKGFVLNCYNYTAGYYYAENNNVNCNVLDEDPEIPDYPEEPDDGTTDDETAAGDINKDGVVNVTDIAMTAAHVKGKKSLSEKRRKRADVNGDGTVSVSDISLIAAHVKGIKSLG